MSQSLKSILQEAKKSNLNGSAQAAEAMQNNPEMINEALELINDQDESIVASAAESLEKYARNHSEGLQIYKDQLVQALKDNPQDTPRVCINRIITGLSLDEQDIERLMKIWEDDFYHSSNNSVRSASLQAFYELGIKDVRAKKKYDFLIDKALSRNSLMPKIHSKNLLK